MTGTESSLARFLATPFHGQTYGNLLYVALAFPLGLLYWTVLSVGFSFGIGTIPLLVGVPILAAVLVFALQLAAFEAWLARTLLDVEVAYEPAGLDGEGLVADLLVLLQTARTYRAIGYLFAKFLLGTVSFTFLATAGSLSVGLLLAPVLYDHPEVAYQAGSWQVETAAGAAGLFAFGVVAVFASLYLLNLWARLSGAFAAALLGPSTDEASSTEPGDD